MRIDSVVQDIQIKNINTSNLSEVLSRLNVGDIIHARVLEMSSNELALKLSDGITLSAATLADIDAKPGDMINLMVKAKNESQLVLETVKSNDLNPTAKSENQGVNLQKELLSIGIKPEAKNIEIAKELKTNGLPINRENFDKVIDTVLKFKDISPAKAAFLLANNAEIEAKNISALNQLIDSRSKISFKLEEIFQGVNEIKDEQSILNIGKRFQIMNSGQAAQEAEASQNQNISKEIAGSIESTKAEEIVKAIKIAINQIENRELKIDSEIKNILTKLSQNINDLGDVGVKLSHNINDLKQGAKLPEKIAAFIENEFNKAFLSSNKDSIADSNQIKNLLLEAVRKTAIEKLSGDIKRTDVLINQNQHNITLEKAKSEIQKAFKSIFVKVDSENLKDEISAKNLYKDILGRLDVIREGIEGLNTQSKSELMNKLDSLDNNLRFMNSINNNSTYVQIPLSIWNRETTGELYVLKRDQKKKKIDPENVTMFISLNTGNLGKVDSLLNINKKSISINLRVENEDIIAFLKDNYKDLHKKLSEKGYKLTDIKYRLLEEEANILNIKDIVEKQSQGNRISIDYRL